MRSGDLVASASGGVTSSTSCRSRRSCRREARRARPRGSGRRPGERGGGRVRVLLLESPCPRSSGDRGGATAGRSCSASTRRPEDAADALLSVLTRCSRRTHRCAISSLAIRSALERPARAARALTERQREVLRLVAEGLDNAEIAERMGISQRTARAHVSSVLERLGVENRTQAAVAAVRQRLDRVPCARATASLRSARARDARSPLGRPTPLAKQALRPRSARRCARRAELGRLGRGCDRRQTSLSTERLTRGERRPRSRSCSPPRQRSSASGTSEHLETRVQPRRHAGRGRRARGKPLPAGRRRSVIRDQRPRAARDTVRDAGVDRRRRAASTATRATSTRAAAPWRLPDSRRTSARSRRCRSTKARSEASAEASRRTRRSFVAQRLDAWLDIRGVDVARAPRAGKSPRTTEPVASVQSPSIAALVRWTNHISDNYYAEMLLKGLGARFGDAGSTAAGASVVRKFQEAAGRQLDGDGRLGPLARELDLAPSASDACCSPRRHGRGSTPSTARCRWPGARARFASACATRPPRAAAGRRPARSSASAALAGYCRSRAGRKFVFALLMNGVNVYRASAAQDRIAAALAGR